MTSNKLQIELTEALTESLIILKEIVQLEAKSNAETSVELLRTSDTKQAEHMFEKFKEKHSKFSPELVWEYSAIGNHYQAMLFDSEETITVSVCPNHYIPWAVRNAVHPREHDFAVIDGFTMSVANVMEIIDEHLENASIRQAIVNSAVLKRQLEKISEEEDLLYQSTEEQMQIEFDRWRVKHGLGSVESYQEYLQANGLTHHKIEAQIRDKRTYNNFLEALCHRPIEEYYEEHKQEFTLYKMESYVAESETGVKELSEFLKSQSDGLCIWARKQFMAESDNARNNYQLNTCWHSQLDKEVAELLVNNPKTGLLPPVEMNGKWTFINILAITPPILDQQTEAIIRQRQVKEWIDEKKKTCGIQWLWGDKDIFPNQNIQES